MQVEVIINRSMGSKHPRHDITYPVNYGFLPGTLSGDGKPIDAYVLGEFKPIDTYKGYVIAYIHRKNDNEDKLVVAKELNKYSKEQIQALTEFVERAFDIEIIMYASNSRKIYRPRAIGLVLHNGKVLLHKCEGDDFWSLPGGGIEIF